MTARSDISLRDIAHRGPFFYLSTENHLYSFYYLLAQILLLPDKRWGQLTGAEKKKQRELRLGMKIHPRLR